MRGKVIGQEVEHRAGGITPAHAGKSQLQVKIDGVT